jgi:ribonuclease BN (tRNA processing enzyme)
MYLLKYNAKHNKKIKIDVVLPKKIIVFNLVSRFDTVFNVSILNEEKEIYIDNAKISFCNTIHKGMSYATKIQIGNRYFVYTSDLARYSKKLEDFVAGSETVLIDAGYPKKKFKTFRNYHGMTDDILRDTAKLNVGKIYASHIRFFSNYNDYIKCFPKEVETELVCIGNSYNMFKEK